MIQRVQTIWLFAIVLLSISLFWGGLIQFNQSDGTLIMLGFSGVHRDSAGISEVVSCSIGLPLIIVLIPVLALAAIILYKKIKLQKTATLLIIALSLCLLVLTAYYWYSMSQKFNGAPVPGIKMAFPPVILVLALMAYRGIVKDERLLKSYDRLR